MSAATHPLIVIGLDGGTFDVLDPLFARGELPTLARLATSGWRTELFSTLPPATLPAWTSFLTAAGPGAHGVTDIFVHGQGDYGLQPASGALRSLPTFMQRLSQQGCQVASLGVPGTFPPEPGAGLCIAGFDAPGARAAGRRAYWPAELQQEVQRLGGWRYATFNEHAGGADKLAGAVDALLADIAAKERVISELYARRRWDLFFVHLQASDTAGHHLWHTFDTRSPRAVAAGHPALADAVPAVYRRLDQLIGTLLRAAPTTARVLVVSDHGMGGASDRAVHINRWLHTQGLLQFRSAAGRLWRRRAKGALQGLLGRLPAGASGLALRHLPPPVASRLVSVSRGAQVDFAHSVAFSDELDYAPSIWLNRRGVFPHGDVTAAAAAALLDQIVTGLAALRDPDTGERLVAAVHRRDDVLHGAHVERAPDLLIDPAWPAGYRPSFVPSDGPGPTVTRLSPSAFHAPKGAGLPGVHRREGIFLAAGPGIDARELPALHIAQAGALVYSLMGRPIPADTEAVLPDFLQELLPTPRAALAQSPASVTPPIDAVGRAEVTRRLAALGYIE